MELSFEEKKQVEAMLSESEEHELAQTEEMLSNAHEVAHFTSAHSLCVIEKERFQRQLKKNSCSDHLPEGISPEMHKMYLEGLEEIYNKKLNKIQRAFEAQFKEPIFNYLEEDGKVKSQMPLWLGIIAIVAVLWFIVTG